MTAGGANRPARHRRRLAMLAVVLLAGCAAPGPPDPEFRDKAAVLAGTYRFDAARFAGDWVARECLGPCPATVSYGVSLTGAVIETDSDGSRAYRADGPGILRRVGSDEVLVVMWVDEGFRTAAIGTASGRRAAIISRAASGGSDRIVAAREMLDFNGWDTGRLVRRP